MTTPLASLAEDLLIPALLAWGYSESTVNGLFGIEEETTCADEQETVV